MRRKGKATRMKTKKASKLSQEIISNRILLIFSLTFVGIAAIFYINRYYLVPTHTAGIGKTLDIMQYVFLAFTLLACAYRIMRIFKPLDKPQKTISPMMIATVSLIVTLSCRSVLATAGASTKFLYVALPATAILYIIFYIYSREFFLSATALAAAAIFFYNIYSLQNAGVYEATRQDMLPLILGGVAVLAVFAFFALVLKKNNGKMKLGKKSYQLIPAAFTYSYLYIVLGYILLGILACIAITALPVAYYLVFASPAIAFLYAVFFTIKLI